MTDNRSAEIQRYDSESLSMEPSKHGNWMHYSDHLADKEASLVTLRDELTEKFDNELAKWLRAVRKAAGLEAYIVPQTGLLEELTAAHEAWEREHNPELRGKVERAARRIMTDRDWVFMDNPDHALTDIIMAELTAKEGM